MAHPSRRSRRVVAVMLPCPWLLCLAVSAASAEEWPATNHLDLIWYDVANRAGPAYEPMAREVERLLGEMGLEVGWSRGASGRAATGHALNVILLDSDGSEGRLSPQVMGAAHRRVGRPSGIWLYYRNVAATLSLDPELSETWRPRDWQHLGRALARVAAHEVVHALAPEIPHRHGGLMSPVMDRRLLLGKRLAWNSGVASRLRARLAVPPVPVGTASSVVAALNAPQ